MNVIMYACPNPDADFFLSLLVKEVPEPYGFFASGQFPAS